MIYPNNLKNREFSDAEALSIEEAPKTLLRVHKKRNLRDMMLSFEILSPPVSLRQQNDLQKL